MAKKTIEVFTCDICGKDAEHSYVLDGMALDLCNSHAAPLKTLEGKGTRIINSKRSTTVTAPSNAKTIKAWAVANGYEVPARGRIPKNIHEAFDKANTV